MNLMPIYSVPLWQSEYPEFDLQKEFLIYVIQRYKENTSSIQKSNNFGYHSEETVHNIEELRPLFEYICHISSNAVLDLDFIDCDIAITSAWLNINDSRQCMNGEHIHGDVLSGVFYLKAPEELLFKRLNNQKSGRPLISSMSDEDLKNFISMKIIEREKFYEQADYIYIQSEDNDIH